MILILNFKLENNLKNVNENFKDFIYKDNVKKVFDIIDNSIGIGKIFLRINVFIL